VVVLALRTVLPFTVGIRDGVVHLVSTLCSAVISARAELGSIKASALPVATVLTRLEEGGRGCAYLSVTLWSSDARRWLRCLPAASIELRRGGISCCVASPYVDTCRYPTVKAHTPRAPTAALICWY
jgi:hypothetical protein